MPILQKFITYLPSEILRPYIKQFAISESDVEQTYKVLPGPSLVIGIQYSGRLFQVQETSINKLDEAGITGLLSSYRMFRNVAGTGTVLIYFTEQGASAFFRQPMDELFGESVSLEHFFPTAALNALKERLAEAKDDRGRLSHTERFLVAHLRYPDTDPLVYAAIQHIQQSQGQVRIKDLAAVLHISQSALERRFRSIVGATPKKYASIIRFNKAIKDFARAQTLTDLANSTGYYDQAHFVKDFKQFSGETPEQFFEG